MLIRKELDIHGFKHLQNQTVKDVDLLCRSLGKILLETNRPGDEANIEYE